MNTGCAECDDQNVMHPDTLQAAGRDLHRAVHELFRPIETVLARICDRLVTPRPARP